MCAAHQHEHQRHRHEPASGGPAAEPAAAAAAAASSAPPPTTTTTTTTTKSNAAQSLGPEKGENEEEEEEKKKKKVMSVCRVCKQLFDPALNHRAACVFHPCAWTGAERSKFYGRLDDDALAKHGTEYYFDCCDATSPDAPGCTRGFHRTYDDD